jgi:hypothetical protein
MIITAIAAEASNPYNFDFFLIISLSYISNTLRLFVKVLGLLETSASRNPFFPAK